MVVLPLAAAAGLLLARRRLPQALPVAFGLVLGGGLVLLEHASVLDLLLRRVQRQLRGGPLPSGCSCGSRGRGGGRRRRPHPVAAGRAADLRADWRVACALVVVACVVWFLASGPEADTVPWWVAHYVGTLLLGAAALPITLLWLRSDQRIAALIAVTLFALWTLYWAVRELVDPQLGLEQSVLRVEIIGAVLTVLACFAAQAGPARAPSAGPSDQ